MKYSLVKVLCGSIGLVRLGKTLSSKTPLAGKRISYVFSLVILSISGFADTLDATTAVSSLPYLMATHASSDTLHSTPSLLQFGGYGFETGGIVLGNHSLALQDRFDLGSYTSATVTISVTSLGLSGAGGV